jgi:hypothetical protein
MASVHFGSKHLLVLTIKLFVNAWILILLSEILFVDQQLQRGNVEMLRLSETDLLHTM